MLDDHNHPVAAIQPLQQWLLAAALTAAKTGHCLGTQHSQGVAEQPASGLQSDPLPEAATTACSRRLVCLHICVPHIIHCTALLLLLLLLTLTLTLTKQG
jgi:hypothetical protein